MFFAKVKGHQKSVVDKLDQLESQQERVGWDGRWIGAWMGDGCIAYFDYIGQLYMNISDIQQINEEVKEQKGDQATQVQDQQGKPLGRLQMSLEG